MQRILAAYLLAFPWPLPGQSSPEAQQVLRTIAELRIPDSVPSAATREACLKQRDKQQPRPLTAYCRVVLEGRVPADTTIWFVSSKDDLAAAFAAVSRHPFLIRPDHTATCPSEQHPRGSGIGYRTAVVLRWVRADSVHAYIRWECSEPPENRYRTPHSRYRRVEEFHVTRRAGQWVAIGGMINVT